MLFLNLGKNKKNGTYLKILCKIFASISIIFDQGLTPQTENNVSPLMIRSAFEFIVEDYAQFPTDKEDDTLKKIYWAK